MAAIPRDEVPDLPDRIIAATAHFYGIPVLTRNCSATRTPGSNTRHTRPTRSRCASTTGSSRFIRSRTATAVTPA